MDYLTELCHCTTSNVGYHQIYFPMISGSSNHLIISEENYYFLQCYIFVHLQFQHLFNTKLYSKTRWKGYKKIQRTKIYNSEELEPRLKIADTTTHLCTPLSKCRPERATTDLIIDYICSGDYWPILSVLCRRICISPCGTWSFILDPTQVYIT